MFTRPFMLLAALTLAFLQDLVAECPAAKELFDKAADILGYDLLKVRLFEPIYSIDTERRSAIFKSLYDLRKALKCTAHRTATSSQHLNTCPPGLGALAHGASQHHT
jgi:hypothetical protein